MTRGIVSIARKSRREGPARVPPHERPEEFREVRVMKAKGKMIIWLKKPK
jgi:hypothetical protein